MPPVNDTPQNRQSPEHAAEATPTAATERVDTSRVVDAIEGTLVSAEFNEFGSAATDILDTAEASESAEDAEGEGGFGEGEDQSKGKNSRGGAAQTTDPVVFVQPLPPPPVMKKAVAAEIRKEIRKQERDVVFVYVGIKKMSPDKLAELVARIRSLKELLASLIEATAEMLKGLYAKWVQKEVV